MARIPESDRPELAQWLINARKEAGFLGAKAFLAALKAAQGKAPSYSSYAQWESGEVQPRQESVRPIREFYAARSAPVTPTLSLEERAVIAAETSAAAARETAAALARIAAAQEAMVLFMAQRPAADPTALAETVAFLQASGAQSLANALQARPLGSDPVSA